MACLGDQGRKEALRMELTGPGGPRAPAVSHLFRELRSFLLAFVHLGFVDALICGKKQKKLQLDHLS